MHQESSTNNLSKLLLKPERRVLKADTNTKSNVSLGVSDMDEANSEALASQLQSKHSHSKPQLPRLNVEQATMVMQGDSQQMPASTTYARTRSIRIPKPLDFPKSTRNVINAKQPLPTTTGSTSNNQHYKNAAMGLGTPSSRALNHANTNITSHDNDLMDTEPASLRLQFANLNSDRGDYPQGLVSPSGGGSRSGQTTNILISQNDDVPDNDHDEEIRSISTLYNQTDTKKRQQRPQINLEVQEARQELDNKFNSTAKKEPLSQIREEAQQPSSIQGGSKTEQDSFAMVFKKQTLTSNQNQSSQLAPGEKPWYYFEGNTSSSQNTKSAIKSSQDVKSNEQINGQILLPDRVNLEKEKMANIDKDQMRPQAVQQMQHLEIKDSQGASDSKDQQKELSSAGGVVDLYSTSNMNTPNAPKGKSQDIDQNNQSQVGPSQINQGRMTLRSVHLSSTDDMKDEVDNARIHHEDQQVSPLKDRQNVKNSQEKPFQIVQQLPPEDSSPTLKGHKNRKIRQSSPLSVSEQNGLASVTFRKEADEGVQFTQNQKTSANRDRNKIVSVSHQDNLFITTEKKRAREEQLTQNVLIPLNHEIFEPSGGDGFVNPTAEYNKIKQNHGIVGGPARRDSGHKPFANNILTPSFISSEMQAAKLRKSDLLLKKKEPSQQANGRNSLEGVAEDFVSSALDHSMCSNGNCLRESRFSVGNINNPDTAPAVNQQPKSPVPFGRPNIKDAGSPAAQQPQINDTESSMILANSSKFSQHQMQMTWQSSNNKIAQSSAQDLAKSRSAHRRGKSNISAMRHSSSFSRKSLKSIRKSTTAEGDAKEVTSFAFYVQNFFYNIFGCCGGAGHVDADKQAALRQSMNSSMHSNMLQYSFVAVPNNNSDSFQDSSDKYAQDSNKLLKSQDQVRRSQLIKDFKAANHKQAKKDAVCTVLDTQNAGEERRETDDEADIDGESDIVDDDDHVANAQRPMQAVKTDYLAPGNRIESSNLRAETNQSSIQQPSMSSQQRITAGAIEIATQLTSDNSQIDEFIYHKPETNAPQNPFQAKPHQYKHHQQEESSGVLDQELALNSRYEAPTNLSLPLDVVVDQDLENQDEEENTELQDLDFQKVSLPKGAIPVSSDKEREQSSQGEDSSARKSPIRRKKSLKDMITQVPQQSTQAPNVSQKRAQVQKSTRQSRSAKQTQEADGRPSQISATSRSSKGGRHSQDNKSNGGASEEDDEQFANSSIDEDDEDYEGEETPDVQKIHFNQTVQALFNIRASNLTMPPFEQIQHLLVDLPEPNHPSKTKTIVFDLDETLIHCVDDVDADNPDVIIPIQFSEEPEPVLAGINIRPFARECLEAANEHFQVVIFTASEQEYADPIIDYLDPEGKLIQARYFRPSCVRTRNPDFYIKDMRIFHQRALSDIILVDNSVYSFAFQLDNGVPIVSFYNDPKDEEMLHLKFYLDCLKDCEDVREKNREAFQLMQLADTQLQRIMEEQQRNSDNHVSYDEESRSPYQHSYRLPEQAQYGSSPPGSNSFVVEEHEEFEDDDDELERDPNNHTGNNHFGAIQEVGEGGRKSNMGGIQHQSNIMEEEEYEEEESFECRL